ncbi:MAG: VWA domain-containing protein [Clostridia bacterium]|nr:VWA domain-containing protein [Clostridia bacterium]
MVIHFDHPWLLLIFLPALALAFIPYFRLSPRYRRTRNRITSLVLFLVVMFLSVNTLAGLTFSYTVPNKENEIILLVDVSDTERESSVRRDAFVETLLRQSKYDNYKVGVVIFGFDQKYAVPLTEDVNGIYDKYLDSLNDLPDTSATDIAAALNYTKTLFNYPETGKIVLVTDGKETDGKAASVARSISASGIRIDAVNVPSSYPGADVQITSVDLPDHHVNINEECVFKINVESLVDGEMALIALSDNDRTDANGIAAATVTLRSGLQTFELPFTFTDTGAHKLTFFINMGSENLTENNTYTTFMSIEKYNKVLIFERTDGSSEKLRSILTKDEAFDVETINFLSAETIPETVDELCAYDQIIMNNVSTLDMKARFNGDDGAERSKNFQLALYDYVYERGGSVLTVGGDTDDGKTNMYDRKAMAGTTYQQMLPVQAIDYTPPLGVIIIIDRSGSMGDEVGLTRQDRLYWAKAGAVSCLKAMTERDYIGIMTLDSNNETILPLTPRPQEAKILAAIDRVDEAGGGTVVTNALESAAQQLLAQKDIDKKHIIVVSDGQFADTEDAIEAAKKNYKNGITVSVVLIGGEDSDDSLRLAAAGNGGNPTKDTFPGELTEYKKYLYDDDDKIVMNMREDLNVPEIKDVVMETFSPIVYDEASNLVRDLDLTVDEDANAKRLTFTLDGFYGTKVRKDSQLVLTGNYGVPLYAQWNFGKGMVGSFMCDIGGKWSENMTSDENGQTFIRRVAENLMPTEDIRPKSLLLEIKEENYYNKMSVYTDLNEGETLVGTITDVSSEQGAVKQLAVSENGVEIAPDFYVTEGLTAEDNYSSSTFVVKRSGVYKIVVKKLDANGNEIDSVEKYKTFSYSSEYDNFSDVGGEELSNKLKLIATRGNGSLIADLEDPYEVFKDFVTELERIYDPRNLFMILAIVLFLLDIIVRKFKFKWPHEIIKAYKEKKEGKR